MRIFKTILSLIIVCGIFYFGFWLGENYQVLDGTKENKLLLENSKPADFSLFWETWDRLEKMYIDKEKLNSQKMFYGAIKGMVKSIGDPYTVFFDPKETKKFLEDVSGEFEGVGMEIGIKKEELLVVSPLEGTPAFKAGIKAGDRILKINETSTIDITIEEAVNLIRGPKGTIVTLTIFRENWEKPKEIQIVRDVIKIPSLKWEIIDSDIAYIKLYHFSEKADSDFRETAVEVLNSSAKKIILDLRNNPGGYLEVARNIAGWFLKKGEIVAIEYFGNGKEEKYKSPGPSKLMTYPVVILINGGSASGAEILAAALRDNLGIKLIGEKTFGKGSVQEVERLSNDSSLKITVAKWLTPKGQLINELGLEPDIKVEMTGEDYENNRDPQLEKALEVIKGL